MEFLLGLFVGVTFWEFFFCLAFFGFGIIAAEWETTPAFFIGLVGALVGLHFLGGWDVWGTLLSHPLLIAVYASAYTIAGGLYSMFVTWPQHLREKSLDIKKAQSDWLSSYNKRHNTNFTTVQPNDMNEFMSSYEYSNFRVPNNVDLIGNLIITWFFDFVWKAINKPITWMWNIVYQSFAKGFAAIGKRTTRSILDDK